MARDQDKADPPGSERAAAQGDGQSWQEAADRRAWFRLRILPLEPVLRGYVRRILPDEADVDDIVQDTFIRIITLSSWRNVASPAAS